jgi:hypothetical protein
MADLQSLDATMAGIREASVCAGEDAGSLDDREKTSDIKDFDGNGPVVPHVLTDEAICGEPAGACVVLISLGLHGSFLSRTSG